MIMLRRPILLLSTLMLTAMGCDSDNEEVTATASESGTGTSGASESASSGTSDSASTTAGATESATSVDTSESGAESSSTSTSSSAGSSDTGSVEGCAAASNADACEGTAGCAWIETSHVAFDVDMVCGDLGIEEGYCLAVERDCGGFLPTCPDGTPVLYRPAGLEVGAVELLVVGASLCEIPNGFQPCQVNSDPKPGSIPSYFPLECGCACE
jgi:hypothetical protein